ncbi:MAG: outer membrane protein assembly factor BamB precursor [Pseudomonadota bacterium]|jgi:outer membrane assembly lipoprotein YfgL
MKMDVQSRQNRFLLALSLCIGVVLFLSACSSTSEKPQPSALSDFKPALTVTKSWSTQISPVSAPLTAQITQDQIALVGLNGLVTVLNAETGLEVWRLALNTLISAGIGSDGNRLAVISKSNELMTLSQGKVLWKAKLPALALTSPFVAGGRVFVLSADRTVTAFDGDSGQKLWSQQRSGDALVLKQSGILTSFQDNLLVGLSGRLVAMNPANGASKWEVTIGSSRGTNEVERLVDLVSGVSRVNNTVCARAFQTSVTCVDAAKGSSLWTRSAQGHVGLSGSESAVFGTESDGKVSAWNRSGGQVLWQSDALRFRGLTAPVAADGQLLVGDDLGWVHWLDANNGQTVARLQIDASGIAMPILRSGKNWVVVTKNGLVQALRAN